MDTRLFTKTIDQDLNRHRRSPFLAIVLQSPLRHRSQPSYNGPPCEASMPFSIRPFRRFPVCCPVTYHAGLCEGQGIIWNLSVNGWRLSGDVPMRVGQTCPLTVNLPNQPSLVVAGAIVRWVRGQEYGLETLVADKQTQSRVEQLVHQLEQVSLESIE